MRYNQIKTESQLYGWIIEQKKILDKEMIGIMMDHHQKLKILEKKSFKKFKEVNKK